MSEEGELTFGQYLAMQEISQMITNMFTGQIRSAEMCRVISGSVDDDNLPMNSAHFRAAGLHFLEGVEQLIEGLASEADDDNKEVDEALSNLRKDIEECRAELTK